MSCRAAVTSQWLRTFAALRVAQCSCALCCLYNDVELGPLQDKKSNLCTPYCTLTWFTYSPRRATTTTVLDFRRLPSSRRLGFSSDRNITKRPCHPVWSCCWHVGTRTVLPNLYDAIFACHLNGQFCFTRCFQHPFYKTTKTLQREVFTLQYSLTDHECDPMWMMKEISLRIFIFDFSFRFFAFWFYFWFYFEVFFYKLPQSFDFVQLQTWIASGDLKVYHRQPIFYWVDKG
jgi:hypothetical protein